jgi:hypothetical protein
MVVCELESLLHFEAQTIYEDKEVVKGVAFLKRTKGSMESRWSVAFVRNNGAYRRGIIVGNGYRRQD